MCFLSIHHRVKLPVITTTLPLLPFHIWISPIQTQPLKSNDATPTVTTEKAQHPSILLGHIPALQPLKQRPTFHSITVLTLMVMSSLFVQSMLYSSPCVACRWLLQGSKGLIGGSAVCRHTTGFFVWCDILGDSDVSIIKKGAQEMSPQELFQVWVLRLLQFLCCGLFACRAQRIWMKREKRKTMIKTGQKNVWLVTKMSYQRRGRDVWWQWGSLDRWIMADRGGQYGLKIYLRELPK